MGSLAIIERIRLDCSFSGDIRQMCMCVCVQLCVCVCVQICVGKTQKDQVHLPHEHAPIQILAGTSDYFAAVLMSVRKVDKYGCIASLPTQLHLSLIVWGRGVN